MLAGPLAQRVGRSRLRRPLLILAMPAVLVVSEPAGAQTCYQFSNALRRRRRDLLRRWPD